MATSAQSGAGHETCGSCGAPSDDTAPVRRVYVTPQAPDLAGPDGGAGGPGSVPDRVEVIDEVEHWCFPCRSLYPHQPVG